MLFIALLIFAALLPAVAEKPKPISKEDARVVATDMILVQDAQLSLQQAQAQLNEQLQPLKTELSVRGARFNQTIDRLRKKYGAGENCNLNARFEWECADPEQPKSSEEGAAKSP